MKQEFVKIKMVLIAVVGIVFLSMITLFLVVFMKNSANKNAQDSTIQQEKIPFEVIDLAEEQEASGDEIDFSDPGDDEIGQEIKELDDLINNTMPGEYDENNLSDEVIEGNIELQ